MNLLVLDKMRFLPECLRADVTPKWLFSCMRSQMDLDVALVQEPSVANVTPMHWLLLAQQSTQIIALEAQVHRRRQRSS